MMVNDSAGICKNTPPMLATINTIEADGLLARADHLGTAFRGRFEELRTRCPLIKEIRILGVMIGIELATDGVPVLGTVPVYGGSKHTRRFRSSPSTRSPPPPLLLSRLENEEEKEEDRDEEAEEAEEVEAEEDWKR